MAFFGHKEIMITPTCDVITKCQCLSCPVQTDRPCAKPKIAARNEMLQNPGKTMQQMMTPGMVKNMEMLKNMNIDQLKGMSMEQMQSMSDEMMKKTPK